MAFDLVQYFAAQIKLQKPSLLKQYNAVDRDQYIQEINALSLGKLVSLWREDNQKLYQEIPKLERFFRILAENSLVSHQERLMDNLSLTAEERFEKFCSKYPTLIQKVPQKQIASFIGVTPEFF